MTDKTTITIGQDKLSLEIEIINDSPVKGEPSIVCLAETISRPSVIVGLALSVLSTMDEGNTFNIYRSRFIEKELYDDPRILLVGLGSYQDSSKNNFSMYREKSVIKAEYTPVHDKRKNGSSFGLCGTMWKAHCAKIVENIGAALDLKPASYMIAKLYKFIDYQIMNCLDEDEYGKQAAHDVQGMSVPTLSYVLHRISSDHGHPWQAKGMLEAITTAVNLLVSIVSIELRRMYDREDLVAQIQDGYDLVCTDTFVPGWRQALELHDVDGVVQFYLFQDDSVWKCHTVRSKIERGSRPRIPIPEEWWGYTLAKASEFKNAKIPKGTLFVHKQGIVALSESRQAALDFAERCMEQI